MKIKNVGGKTTKPDFVLHVVGDELELFADKVAAIPQLLPGHAQDLGVPDRAAVHFHQCLAQVAGDLERVEAFVKKETEIKIMLRLAKQ